MRLIELQLLSIAQLFLSLPLFYHEEEHRAWTILLYHMVDRVVMIALSQELTTYLKAFHFLFLPTSTPSIHPFSPDGCNIRIVPKHVYYSFLFLCNFFSCFPSDHCFFSFFFQLIFIVKEYPYSFYVIFISVFGIKYSVQIHLFGIGKCISTFINVSVHRQGERGGS